MKSLKLFIFINNNEESYSYIPESKAPATIKFFAKGALPKGVFNPVGEIRVILSPISRLKY